MSQSAQAVETNVAAAALSMLGSREVDLHFPAASESTRTATASFNPPPGTQAVTIALQRFDLKYTNHNHYDFGQLQVSLRSPSNTVADCTVTLRDDNINKREWQGTVTGLVTFFG